jgi:hypothetical protein
MPSSDETNPRWNGTGYDHSMTERALVQYQPKLRFWRLSVLYGVSYLVVA